MFRNDRVKDYDLDYFGVADLFNQSIRGNPRIRASFMAAIVDSECCQGDLNKLFHIEDYLKTSPDKLARLYLYRASHLLEPEMAFEKLLTLSRLDGIERYPHVFTCLAHCYANGYGTMLDERLADAYVLRATYGHDEIAVIKASLVVLLQNQSSELKLSACRSLISNIQALFSKPGCQKICTQFSIDLSPAIICLDQFQGTPGLEYKDRLTITKALYACLRTSLIHQLPLNDEAQKVRQRIFDSLQAIIVSLRATHSFAMADKKAQISYFAGMFATFLSRHWLDDLQNIFDFHSPDSDLTRLELLLMWVIPCLEQVDPALYGKTYPEMISALIDTRYNRVKAEDSQGRVRFAI